MKKIFEEQTTIFFNILRWTFLAVLIGVVVGFASTFFLKALNYSVLKAEGFHYYYFLMPLIFPLSSFLINKLAPQAKGHGTEKVIEAIHLHSGKIPLLVAPVKLITTILTVAGGGSAGKEGPSGQIGATLASAYADIFRFSDANRRKLVICGISAGFATVFGTPVSGAIFGVEVLFAGSILYDVMLPSFISGIIAFHISNSLGIKYFYHNISYKFVFSNSFFLKILLAGIIFGLVSFLLIESMKYTDRLAHSIRLNRYLRDSLGGLFLVVVALIISSRYVGMGIHGIENTLNGSPVEWYDFLLKILFTAITLSFGGSGGIVTPIFFIGATVGSLYGGVLGLDRQTFAAAGMVGMLAGAANTPIAASIMSIELFGAQFAPYAAICCVISFLMTGHRSVYPSQILAIKKSEYINVQTGATLDKVQAEVTFEQKRRLYKMLRKQRELLSMRLPESRRHKKPVDQKTPLDRKASVDHKAPEDK